jgi:hypothetical protein
MAGAPRDSGTPGMMAGVQPRSDPGWPATWLGLSVMAVLLTCFLAPALSRPGGPAAMYYLLPAYVIAAFASLVASTVVVLRYSYLKGERELRRRQGLCPECGYDLTGNASGVCPECGTCL